MGKSPGKWIKTLLFGKKSARSNGNKGRNTTKSGNEKGYAIAKGTCASTENPPVISEPVLVSTHSNGTNSELEKGNPSSCADVSLISPPSVGADNEGIAGAIASNEEEKFREENAAIKAQAAFRGFLARRAFRALKGIIRLQALVRGHLVRRQAVVTLHSTLAIVKLQAIVRGQKVRAAGLGLEVNAIFCKGRTVVAKRFDSSKGKIYSNVFASKLLSSSLGAVPLRIQYEQGEPNSVFCWMQRWTFSHFWKPPSQPKKTLNARSPAKRGSYAMETESGRTKRNFRRNSPINVDIVPSNVSSEPEKPKRNPRKVAASADSVHDNPQSELEKVKRNLRKVSSSYIGTSNKQEVEIDTQSRNGKKMSISYIGTCNKQEVEIDTQSLNDKVSSSQGEISNKQEVEIETQSRNGKKVSSSHAETPDKEEVETDTQCLNAKKMADSPSDTSEKVTNDSSEKTKKDVALSPEPKLDIEIASKSIAAEVPLDPFVDNSPAADANPSPSIDNEKNSSVVNGDSSVKDEQTCNENHKTSKRRSSFSAKSEYAENIAQNTPTVPSYMQVTESAKAKLRGQNSPRFGSDAAEKNGATRRHSLPSSTNGKATSHSPRTQRILQASGKGSIRSDRSLLSLRDANEKPIQVEWRR